MGEKVEKRLGRLELADYLADLSQQLRRGELKAGGRLWTVPEQVEVKIHLKEEEGQVSGKIGWQWVVSGTAPHVATEAPQVEPASFKAVKLKLAASFKELQRVVGEGLFPDQQLLADFREDSRSFAALARPEWQQPMAEYLKHLENFQDAVVQRLAETMRQELHNLTTCMTSCHREFK
jgi:XXXCH domain-containing protein